MPIFYSKPADLAFSTQFKEKITDVYSFFPELQQQDVKCGIIRKRGSIQGVATSWTQPRVIRLRHRASLYTIAHELTHLVQGGSSGIPQGEVACDIWVLDRMPIEYIDQPPYYLLHRIDTDWKANRVAIKQMCTQAIAARRSMRTYISWLRCRIKEL